MFSTLRRSLAAMASIALLSGSPAVAATVQIPSDSDMQAMELGRAAIHCALLAAATAEGAKAHSDIDRLVDLALPGLRRIGDLMSASSTDETFGPWGPLFSKVDADFFVGMTFDQEAAKVQADLERAEPVLSDPGTYTARQQVEAENEYLQRNCGLLGSPEH